MTTDHLLLAYRSMSLARSFDQALINLYRQSKIVGGVYAQIGNEATSVGTAMALEEGDLLFPMHRDTGALFVRGMTAKALAVQFLFRVGSMTRGTDGTGHFADPQRRIYGNVSHLGSMVPVACGAALAEKMKSTDANDRSCGVALTYIGDGGASVGEVHEGLMFASTMKLPFILIIENNQYAYSTPVIRNKPASDFSSRAIGYGIPGVTVDGTDIEAVYSATKEAVVRARNGEGASIIECVTMRMRGHAEHDPFDYVPESLLQEWATKDPLSRIADLLRERGVLESEIEAVSTQAKSEIENAVEYANTLPSPNPEEARKQVYV